MGWKLAWAGLVLAVLGGCAATESGRDAQTGVTADVATTGIGLTLIEGAAEANPLALPLLPLRYSVSRRLENERCTNRRSGHAVITGTAYAAAGNNLLLLMGASFPPLGLIAGIPMYQRAMRQPCVPVRTEAHMVLLARWWDAYVRGDVAALQVILDNEQLAADYADLFYRTDGRMAVYSRMESVGDGFFAEYEATLWFPDGRNEKCSDEMKFTVAGNRIVDIRQRGVVAPVCPPRPEAVDSPQ